MLYNIYKYVVVLGKQIDEPDSSHIPLKRLKSRAEGGRVDEAIPHVSELSNPLAYIHRTIVNLYKKC